MTTNGRYSAIRGTGSALPERTLTNAELERMVDTSDEWISTRTGIQERRVAGENEYLSVLATRAAERALEASGLAGAEVDLIICATVTPDRPFPASACFIQENLGARHAAAFDLSAGCSGFIYGLAVANGLLASGTYRNALLIGAEILSKYVNWKDRSTCVLFGDGAGAVVLTRGDGPHGVLATAMHSDGKMAVRSMEEASREVLRSAGLTPGDIDLFIPHQANRRIIDAVGSRLELRDEQVYVNIERVGNTSAASIPVALDEVVRKGLVHRGDNLLFAAFGTGLTWGAALCRWGW